MFKANYLERMWYVLSSYTGDDVAFFSKLSAADDVSCSELIFLVMICCHSSASDAVATHLLLMMWHVLSSSAGNDVICFHVICS